MIIVRKRKEQDSDELPFEYIEGKCWMDEDTTIEHNWERGDYMAYVEVHWKDIKSQNNFVFRTYSKDSPKIVEVPKDAYPDFLENALKSWAKSWDVKKTYSDNGKFFHSFVLLCIGTAIDIFRSFSITESKAEYGFLYYENNTEDITLRELVKFDNLQNLELMDPYEGTNVEVTVKPKSNLIILLNRKDRGWSFNWTYFTSLVKPMPYILKSIKTKGKKNQIQHNGEKYDIFYYIYKDGSGYTWFFENLSSEITFEWSFFFELQNIQIVNATDPDSKEFSLKLKPGENKAMKLIMKELDKSWGYKYSYSFKCKEDITNNNQLVEKIKRNGLKKQIKYKKKEVDVFYYILFMNERYYWYYENNTEMVFKATFLFEFLNLRVEHIDEGPSDKWDILLKPNESCIKCIERINPKEESKYKSSYTYSLLEPDNS
jgi:hypothetical protein